MRATDERNLGESKSPEMTAVDQRAIDYLANSSDTRIQGVSVAAG